MKKYLILSATSFIILFQNFSFAIGLSYHYMKDQNMEDYNLPLSHALYLKEDGTVCITDFENLKDQNNISAQYENSVTKCNNEDTQIINNIASEYLNNKENSLVKKKVSLPLAGAASVGLACIIGGIETRRILKSIEPQDYHLFLKGHFIDEKNSAILGTLFGSLIGIPIFLINGGLKSSMTLKGIAGLSIPLLGASAAVFCHIFTYALKEVAIEQKAEQNILNQ